MNICAGVRRHQRFAQQAGTEVRNDEGGLRERQGEPGDAERIAQTQVKAVGSPSFRTPTDRTPQCTNTAVPGCAAAIYTIWRAMRREEEPSAWLGTGTCVKLLLKSAVRGSTAIADGIEHEEPKPD